MSKVVCNENFLSVNCGACTRNLNENCYLECTELQLLISIIKSICTNKSFELELINYVDVPINCKGEYMLIKDKRIPSCSCTILNILNIHNLIGRWISLNEKNLNKIELANLISLHEEILLAKTREEVLQSINIRLTIK